MNKKGFTLIELLTVIAIIGILTLLSAPKFLGYTEKTNIVKIQTGIKSVETFVNLKDMEDSNFTEDWTNLTSEEIQEINDSGKLIDRKGLIKEILEEGAKHIPLKEIEVKWNSGGVFILDKDKESVYYYNKDYNTRYEENSPNNPKPEPNNPKDEDEIYDDDFIWIKTSYGYGYTVNGEEGYFKYVGNKSTVVVPEKIHGHTMTSYYKLFSETNVSKVISHNKNITDMSRMFEESQATFLNLSELDTSNVTDMSKMFEASQAKTLDLTNFNTSKVTDMACMFTVSKARFLNLSGFDTSNVTNMFLMFAGSYAFAIDVSSFSTSRVTDMSGMFAGSFAMTLDLSSFNTSRVTNMNQMFDGAFAITGYARNSREADKLNAIVNEPYKLKFTVKSP